MMKAVLAIVGTLLSVAMAMAGEISIGTFSGIVNSVETHEGEPTYTKISLKQKDGTSTDVQVGGLQQAPSLLSAMDSGREVTVSVAGYGVTTVSMSTELEKTDESKVRRKRRK